jgi:hypothetical protein
MTKPRRGRSGLRLDDRRSIPSGVLSIHCPFPGIPPGLRPSSNFAHSSHRFQLAASSAFATSNVAAAPLGVDARGSGQNNPALCDRIPHERVMARTAAPEPRSPYGTFRRDEGGEIQPISFPCSRPPCAFDAHLVWIAVSHEPSELGCPIPLGLVCTALSRFSHPRLAPVQPIERPRARRTESKMNGRLDARERQGERLCYQPTPEAAKAEFEASWRQWRGQNCGTLIGVTLRAIAAQKIALAVEMHHRLGDRL